MYFLKDLALLSKLADLASKDIPTLKPTSGDDSPFDENAVAGTTPLTDSDLAKSIEKEDSDNGT